MIEIVSVVLNVVLGSSFVLFYSANKRKEAAEASNAEIGVKKSEFEIHRHSVEFLSKQLHEAYQEVDKMQEIINEKRNHILELMRISKQLEMDLIADSAKATKMEMYVCGKLECNERVKISA